MTRSRLSRLGSFTLVGVGTAGLVLLAWSAAAQVIGDRPVLHLDVPPPGGANSASGIPEPTQPLFGPEPGAGQNPSAFAYRSKILPAPTTNATPSEDEPVHGRRGFAVDRVTESKPDNITSADDTLQYVSVFNPSILPFKRMSALDSVRPDYTLEVANEGALTDVEVGGAPSPDRDLFWGDMVVEFTPNRDIAIPSVAPDMRILSYETEPALNVTFAKDGADNYFVRSTEGGASQTFRLRFMADASASYFAPQIPSNLRVRDVAEKAPPGILHPIPDSLRDSVESALIRLSINRNMPLRRALNRLVRHFREFEAGRLTQTRDSDIYLDLVQQQLGVCRHRAFAFMITANGLGLPTRYVTNEAHAWVEVWVPEASWMRIDLGGSALRMVVDNAEDKSLYQARGEDPFTKPPGYQSNYTRLEGDISGLSDEQVAEGRTATSNAANESFQPRPVEPDQDPRNLMIAPGPSLPAVPDEMTAGKEPTRLSLSFVDAEGFRGETITVSGRLLSAGQGVGGQRIDVYLAPTGQSGENARLAARTVSESDGGFTVYAQLPSDLELGEYEIYASTPGDSRFAPTLSE